MLLKNLFQMGLPLQPFQRRLRICGFKQLIGSFSSTANSTILKETDGAVRILTLNNPSRKNPVNPEECMVLAEAIKEADTDPSVNIIAFTGKGDVFCSGMDLVAVKNAPSAEDYANRGLNSFCQFFAAFIDCKKPIVGLVNGPAVGLGVTVLGLCDTAYGASTATFSAPFTAMGICMEGASSYTFPRIIGYSKASSLLVINDKISVTQALQCGLISDVIKKEDFEVETRKRLRAMSELPLKSLLYSKELIRGRERALLHAANNKERDGLRDFLQSTEFISNVNNFFNRKKK